MKRSKIADKIRERISEESRLRATKYVERAIKIDGLLQDLSKAPQHAKYIRVNGKTYTPSEMITMIQNNEQDGLDYTKHLFE